MPSRGRSTIVLSRSRCCRIEDHREILLRGNRRGIGMIGPIWRGRRPYLWNWFYPMFCRVDGIYLVLRHFFNEEMKEGTWVVSKREQCDLRSPFCVDSHWRWIPLDVRRRSRLELQSRSTQRERKTNLSRISCPWVSTSVGIVMMIYILWSSVVFRQCLEIVSKSSRIRFSFQYPQDVHRQLYMSSYRTNGDLISLLSCEYCDDEYWMNTTACPLLHDVNLVSCDDDVLFHYIRSFFLS